MLVDDLNLEMLVNMGNELINLNESGEPNQNLNDEYSRLFRAESIFETKMAEILMLTIFHLRPRRRTLRKLLRNVG